ncbi:MAG: O-antigen ligase family protein [Thermoanaerobaculia bacterium]|nr:O-antigen ligase family protein [Thermoanaerobaculia bacterium]
MAEVWRIWENRDVFPRVLLFFVVALPALALSVGRVEGRAVFVLYREPKLVVAMCGIWLLLGVLAWRRPEVFRFHRLAATMRQPAAWLGVVLGVWFATTGLWARVPENWLYELAQYVTFGGLFLVLGTWSRDDPDVAATIQWALVASLGIVTAIGLWQWAGLPLPMVLPPIRPELGALHPSLMGYKNPAALAVTGQVLVLVGLASRTQQTWQRAALGGLVALELLYVASLGSRTAILALGTGLAVCLAGALWTYRRDAGRAKATRIVLGSALVFVVFLLAVAAARPEARDRIGSMLRYFASPADYLDSDRGTYLRNTVHMARIEPWGVGLGDWQTTYPVFRRFGRTVSFDESFEVRRAHSDHVQVLGETGWVGLTLWLAWLGTLVISPFRRFHRSREPAHLFLAGQIVVLATAMATDYFVEWPYGKFQLFLLATLALSVSSRSHVETRRPGPGRVRVLAFLVVVLATLVFASQWMHLRRSQIAAEMERRYGLVVGELQKLGRVERSRLEAIRTLGVQHERWPGVDKTAYRTYLVMAHVAHLAGKSDEALGAARRATRLHPYSIDALDMMARITSEPCATRWRGARDHVSDEATRGFEGRYPVCGLTFDESE